jgi:small subunit ribosomal protein S1
MAAKKITKKEFEKLISKSKSPKIFNTGDIVEGTIINIGPREMILDVEGRAEGIVKGSELKLDGEKLNKKTGDKVIAYVISPENEEGLVELSIRRTGSARKWFEIKQAKENDETITVRVVEANSGGVLVEIGGGIRGFVPRSHLKTERIYTGNSIDYSNKEEATKEIQVRLAEMIGEELEVKVMEIDEEKNRVILSEKFVYSDNVEIEKREETLQRLQVGSKLKGEVTGITPFGLFVNAEGLEGLVHLSEISWDKVSNPADFYKVGDVVDVQVIGLQDAGKRVAYSIKRLKPDPWKTLIKKYKVGQIVKGEVTSIANYGAFVKIEDGLNGLIHISELSNKIVRDPADIVQEGQIIEVMIISISDEDRHLGLSLKRLQKKSNKVGAKVEEIKDTQDNEESSRELEGLEKILKESEE